LNAPNKISFCPTSDVLRLMHTDYESMKSRFIYGDPLDFEKLIRRLGTLQERFRAI